MDFDDEADILDNQLADAHAIINNLQWTLLKAKEEWEDTYPYEVLELSLEAMRCLATKVFLVFPDDMETQGILQQMEAEIAQALQEPEVFYLSD